jgi:catechol 2,3-dioxygenase-like lactoylglutathione lyase family enzyme
MPPVRLHHASVQVPAQDLERCSAFYRDVLGLRQVENLAGIAWFELPNGDHIHLLEGQGAATSGAHFALQVDDFEDTLARVVEHGGEVHVSDDLWGSPRRFIRDPAGNLLEVFSSPPPLGMPGVTS